MKIHLDTAGRPVQNECCGRFLGETDFGCPTCGAEVEPPGLYLCPPSPLRIRQARLREQGRTWLEILYETRVERRREMRPKDGVHMPVVYYMRMDGLVKIGTTTRISRRLISIRPQGVLAIERGGRDVERQRHAQFAEHHSHGEWYWLADPVWQHVAEVRTRPVTGWLGTDDWLEVWGKK